MSNVFNQIRHDTDYLINSNIEQSSSSSSSSNSLLYFKPEQPLQLFHFNTENDACFSQQNSVLDSDQQQHNQSLLLVVEEHGRGSSTKNAAQNSDMLLINNLATNEPETSSNSSQTSLDSRQAQNKPHGSTPVNYVCSSTTTATTTAITNTIVPTISNSEEIFQLLSQKIAKYCQILADLTNCEVFYKAQLPLASNSKETSANKPNRSKYKPKIVVNKNIKSLYWGTNKMLFQYSHGDGIKFEKINGDSLIKISNRSLTSDINSLIEELLLSEPNSTNSKLNNSSTAFKLSTKHMNQENSSDKMKLDSSSGLRDCFVTLERLDDNIFEHYLNKFETVNNNLDSAQTMFALNELIDDEYKLDKESEYFSDEYNNINENNKRAHGCIESSLKKNIKLNENCIQEVEIEEEDESGNDEDEDLDEKELFERNCFNLNDTNNNSGFNENDYDLHNCEYCTGHSYKHLTQLKLHQLKVHLQAPLCSAAPFECAKCKQASFATRLDYLKHTILCYYPNAYTCNVCSHSFDNYTQYIFHLKYIHTPVVYMCALCSRKYRTIKDLLEHDQLMHSKSVNYCEYCYEPQKSRDDLYEHYRSTHLTNENETPFKTITLKDSDALILDEYNEKQRHDASLIDHIVIAGQVENQSRASLTNESSSNENILSESDEQEDSDEADLSKVHKNDLIRGLIDRKHQCKWCALRFYSKSQLKQHESAHVNAMLQCPVCDKQFTNKDRLSGHMKCHMEPQLECKVCGKKFKRLCNLYNHELVHGLTEHAFMLCQFCGRGFRSRRDYQNHVIANHRDLLMKQDPNSKNSLTFDSNKLQNEKKTGAVVKRSYAKKSNTNKPIQNETNRTTATASTAGIDCNNNIRQYQLHNESGLCDSNHSFFT